MRGQAIVNAMGGLSGFRVVASGLVGRHVILLVCSLLAAGVASAAGRDSPSPPSRDKKADTSTTAKADDWRQGAESWLARLEGSFTIKLTVEEKTVCSSLGNGGPGSTQRCTTRKAVSYVSAGSCSGTGEGSGMQCTFDALRYEASGNGAAGAGASVFLLSNQLPGQVLFGIDPAARRINVTMRDPKGATFSGAGKLAGNELTFKERCAVDTTRERGSCTWGLWIKVPPDGRRILMTRTTTRSMGVDMNTLSGIEEPHTFELTRVEQPAAARE